MQFLRRFSPFVAIRDLRLFLSQRQPYEIWFLMLAITLTGLLLVGFAHDAREERPYKRDIVYVQQWKLDRTDAQIVSQQKIDQVQRDKDAAELKKRQDAMRATFKRLDDGMSKYGL